MSDQTRSLLDSLNQRATGGGDLQGAGSQFIQNLLGGNDPNAYRGEEAGMMRDLSGGNENLDRYMEMLFSGQMPGSPEGGGGGYGSSYRGGYGGGGGGGAGAEPVGAAAYIKEILEGKFLGEENPFMQQRLDAMTRDLKDQFTDVKIPGVNDEFAGMGRYGSGAFSSALAQTGGEYADSLADMVGNAQYQDYSDRMADYQNALGLGAQMDMSAADRAAQLQAAGMSAGAARYQADQERQSRESLARMQALQGAIGMDIGLGEFGASGMSGLAGMYSGDQMSALGMAPEIGNMDLGAYELAGQFGLGGDQNLLGGQGLQDDWQMGLLGLNEQQQARLSQERAQAAAQRAAQRAQQQRFNWERYRYGREAPWNDLARFSDVINSMSGGYGTTREEGMDLRSQQPYSGSPIAQGIAGGIGGWQIGQGLFNNSPQNPTGGGGGGGNFGINNPDPFAGYQWFQGGG